MVQVHHAASALPDSHGPDEEIFRDLNFRGSEFLADLVALGLREDVAALYHHNLARFKLMLGKKAATLNRTLALFYLWREKSQVSSRLFMAQTRIRRRDTRDRI
jgi:hypothetical protein